jgi:hypothetical protein
MISSQNLLFQQQNYNRLAGMNNINNLIYQQNIYANLHKKNNYYLNNSGMTTDAKSSTDADSLIYNNYDRPKDIETHIIIKSSNQFLSELFKAYNEDNCLCNFILFKKNIELNLNIDNKGQKDITLFDYFDLFKEVSFLCLNVPYLENKGNIIYNIFNPTLSSMILLIKTKIKIDENINKKHTNENVNIYSLPNDYIRIEFDETNPPYNRDIIDSKIKIIKQIMGKKRITLDKINKDKSYLSILWTPADTYKINTSFLSYYSFDFKLIGILIIKRNDCKWFTSFSNNIKAIKDFKTDYLNNINKVENFIKNCNQNNGDSNFERKFFSQDYKRYIYNS